MLEALKHGIAVVPSSLSTLTTLRVTRPADPGWVLPGGFWKDPTLQGDKFNLVLTMCLWCKMRGEVGAGGIRWVHVHVCVCACAWCAWWPISDSTVCLSAKALCPVVLSRAAQLSVTVTALFQLLLLCCLWVISPTLLLVANRCHSQGT